MSSDFPILSAGLTAVAVFVVVAGLLVIGGVDSVIGTFGFALVVTAAATYVVNALRGS